MRAAALPSDVGVMMFSRTNRPFTGVDMLTVVTAAVLPRIWDTVVNVVPSVDTWMSASLVFQVGDSPPASALRSVNDVIDIVEPRSTRRNLLVATSVQNLSELPPDTLPLNALSGPSLVLHAVEPVAGLPRATFVGPPPPLPYTSTS